MVTAQAEQSSSAAVGAQGRTRPPLTRAPDEPLLRVALDGLPPIYCHGLLSALATTGIIGARPTTPAQWQELLAVAGPLVPVVETTRAAALTSMLAQNGRQLPVVHVVATLSEELCAEALRAGATGVVAVDAELGHVVDVVRAAAAGQTLLPKLVASALCRSRGAPAPDLTLREREWLRRLADARTVATLARTAGYSEREMYRLLNGLYARMGATNRTEALLVAQRCGLLDEHAEA